MKITMDRSAALANFGRAAAVAPARTPKPILQNILLTASGDGGVEFVATDLEVSIRTRLAADDCQVETDGKILLPIGRFGAILRECPSDQIVISQAPGEQTFSVYGDASRFRLPCADPAEFPAVRVEPSETTIEAEAGAVLRLFSAARSYIDTESTRFALGGVKLEAEDARLVGIATDGRRLIVVRVPATIHAKLADLMNESQFIVASGGIDAIITALKDVPAAEQVKVWVTNSGVHLQTELRYVGSRLIEGRFPKWRDVVDPAASPVVELPCGQFMSLVRQAAIFTDAETNGVDFTLSPGKLSCQAAAADAGDGEVSMVSVYDGAHREFTLDQRFVRDAIVAIGTEKVATLEMIPGDHEGERAVHFRGEDVVSVVMPLARERR